MLTFEQGTVAKPDISIIRYNIGQYLGINPIGPEGYSYLSKAKLPKLMFLRK